jgi:hypothetical protein
MENKICIGYLTDDRRIHTFEKFIYFLDKLENKNSIHLLILLNNYDKNYFIEIIKNNSNNINYSIALFNNDNNYINKIKYFIEYTKFLNFKYCLKFDNDIIMNNYALDYLITNINVIDNPKNLYIAPVISSGIPSVDLFINDFLTDDEKNVINNLFKNTVMPNYLWNFDYSKLNDSTINSKEWNISNYWKNVDELPHYYKGLHPIRINKEAICYLNNIILKYKHKIYQKQDYKIKITNEYPYFCNSIFAIKVLDYEKLINDSTLYVDPYDEVPVNRYLKLSNMNGVFITNSFSIHPFYNTIPNHLNLEKHFFNAFFAT